MRLFLWVLGNFLVFLSIAACGERGISLQAREVATVPKNSHDTALPAEVDFPPCDLPVGPENSGTSPTAPAMNEIHRFYNESTSLHLFSLNQLETAGLPAFSGWSYERATFRLFSTAYADCTRALYRCHHAANNSHFVSPSAECEGQTNEGLLGYSCPTAAGGMNTLLTRYYNPNNGDHLVTISGEGEILAANGWTAEPQLALGFIAPIY